MFDSYEEELENFLGATFHQDIESPEDELQEYINMLPKGEILDTIQFIRKFIVSNLTDKEKNNFIETNTELYFPAIGMKPIEWLEEVLVKLENAL